ncbi:MULTISPECIES: hypothetical protein [Henriciella]|jgi:hypothetical protein|uniref:hypothetical protein n=1 Tax=Henriciella TaxID=453849 RepID=UPI00351413BA
MLTRAWILDILTRLPLWYWPIFFWEVAAFERYYRAYRAANPVGILGIGVTPQGRIVIRLQEAGDAPAPADWTDLAPRAPWTRLAPDEGMAGLAPVIAPPIACLTLAPRPEASASAPALLEPG